MQASDGRADLASSNKDAAVVSLQSESAASPQAPTKESKAVAGRSSLEVLQSSFRAPTRPSSVDGRRQAPQSLSTATEHRQLHGLLQPTSLEPASPPIPTPNLRSPTAVPSNASLLGVCLEEASAVPTPDPIRDYLEFIERLGAHLPYLKNVQRRPGRKGVSAACVDWRGDECSQKYEFNESNLVSEAAIDSLESVLTIGPSAGVTLRIITVEDLTQEAICVLGSTLRLSPEFFEEHLINSGWRNDAVRDSEASTWHTGSLAKSYASLRWVRPMRMVNEHMNPIEAREQMLAVDKGRYKWKTTVAIRRERKEFSHPMWHQAAALCNIMRPVSSFSATQGGAYRRETAYRTHPSIANRHGLGKVAQEERATVCSFKRGGCIIVVILLDPLLLMNHWAKGSGDALETTGFSPNNLAKLQKKERLKTQRSWADTLTASNEIPRSVRSSQTTKLSQRRPDKKREKDIQILRALSLEQIDLDVERNLAENMPADRFDDGRKFYERPGPRRRANIRAGTRYSTKTLLVRIGHTVSKANASGDEGSSLSGSLHDMSKDTATLRAGPLIQCMYRNWSPRAPFSYDSTFSPANIRENPELVSELFTVSTSTAYDLNCWMSQEPSSLADPAAPIVLLLRIICADVTEYTYLVSSTLTDIGREMLHDRAIQEQLLYWQDLLEQFEYQCRTIHASIVQFISILLPSVQPITTADYYMRPLGYQTPVASLLSQTMLALQKTREHTRRTTDALIANMNVLESERGISGAESVNRLTELAFIFIPLSFSASVFGMQVKELDPSSTSISAFFVLSIVSIVVLIVARLAVRSEALRAYRKRLLSSIRISAGLVDRAPVPTFVFMRYAPVQSIKATARTAAESGLLIALASVGLSIVLVPIWLSQLDGEIKVALTIPLALLGGGILVVWFWTNIQMNLRRSLKSYDEDLLDD